MITRYVSATQIKINSLIWLISVCEVTNCKCNYSKDNYNKVIYFNSGNLRLINLIK